MSSDAPTTLLGLDVGGTKCAAVLGTPAGDILARREWPSRPDRGPEAMLSDLISSASALLAERGTHPRERCAVGVAIGGPLDAAAGIIHSPPNLPGWDAFPLKSRLESTLGLPVRVQHDASACALAEHRWGAGRNARRLAYLTCGTGFGVGLIFDGIPYAGANGRNCELGHWRIRTAGPVAFGKTGSAEACCSARSLARWATFLFPARWPEGSVTSEEIADLWRSGDAQAAAAIAHNAQAVGDVCASLADLLQLDTILLGSLARYLGQPWVEQVQAQTRAECLNLPNIIPATLRDRLQDLSALAAAISA
jgi:glucokinase